MVYANIVYPQEYKELQEYEPKEALGARNVSTCSYKTEEISLKVSSIAK